ncbi:MAG: hypothetical protein JW738_09630 [Actinobacteria bacterium]|nr:hypothetical protein [Actinomycetota bacterium]
MSVLTGFYIPNIIDNSFNIDKILASMTRRLFCDGAADEISWCQKGFGFKRLYFQGSDPAHTPIRSDEDAITLFLDGEVFNRDGAKNLRSYDASSYEDDARYCMDLFLQHGTDGFKWLNGSFLIIIFDRNKRELIVVNDRFASRPLFYFRDNQKIAFGTQLGPILGFPGISKDLEPQSIYEFFTFERVLEDRTFLKGIMRLPPSTVLRFKEGGFSLNKYWNMEYCPDYSVNKKEYAEKLASTYREAVKIRLRGNARKGLLLSGGLDARMVLAAAKDIEQLETITIADSFNREAKTAMKISETAECEHHFIERPCDHYVNLIDGSVRTSGGLYRFDHAHFNGLYDQIREHCDIIFHGFDPEVLFRASNMPRNNSPLLGKRIKSRDLQPISEDSLIDTILNNVTYSNWRLNPAKLFSDKYADEYESSTRSVVSKVISAMPNDASIYNKYDWFVVHNRLNYPSAFMVISMRSFMNERSAVTDNNLLDLYLGTPPEYRANTRVWINSMKMLDRNITKIKDANTGISPLAPYSLTVLSMLGNKMRNSIIKGLNLEPPSSPRSWPNFHVMIRENENFRNMIMNTISDPECIDPEIFDIDRVKIIADLHMGGIEEHRGQLFLLVTFGRWYKLYFSGNGVRQT